MNVRIQTYGTFSHLATPYNPSLTPSIPFQPLRKPRIQGHCLINDERTEGTTATAALEKGLQDLEDLCDVVSEEFWTARNQFNASQT